MSIERLDLTKYDGHTPGPWVYRNRESRFGPIKYIEAPEFVTGHSTIAGPVPREVFSDEDYDEKDKDGLLIADAVLLKDALVLAYKEIDELLRQRII